MPDMIAAMDVERGQFGPLPYFAAGSGAPLAFLGGLAPDTGVGAESTVKMNGSLIKPLLGVRRGLFFNPPPAPAPGKPADRSVGAHARGPRSGVCGPTAALLW